MIGFGGGNGSHPQWAETVLPEPESLEEVMELVAKAMSAKLASGIRVIDVSAVVDYVDYIAVCQGQTALQNRAIADLIVEELKRYGIILSSLQGYRNADWVLIDYEAFVVHVFLPEMHDFYEIEELYSEGTELELSYEGL